MAKLKTAAPVVTEASKCPITLTDFLAKGGARVVTIGQGDTARQVVASPKKFSTGSFGWHAGEKVVVDIGGVPVKCQLNFILTVVGSKPAA